ncbi:SHOCT domain-containing protein [Halorubrum vacuolatum]|uniref:Short C-terminal domain-containing protein n=1 Tax=Halorubrum vacuolatum TaxID=63740 RepID=A0A238WLK2_HALVU|nr:SHOCT domain-containing protein [Halorubrum vacuolatum]SNR46569.1 hypothetical protein SAMN06264855_10856 [Halorubrum vacuolatum]
MSELTVRDRAKRNASGIAALLVTGTWLPALILGYDWWLAALLFGYIVVVPITAMLFEEENPVLAEASDRRADALDEVRARYAAGEIDYDEFEKRLEDVLETETVADATDHVARRRATATTTRDAGGTDRDGGREAADDGGGADRDGDVEQRSADTPDDTVLDAEETDATERR